MLQDVGVMFQFTNPTSFRILYMGPNQPPNIKEKQRAVRAAGIGFDRVVELAQRGRGATPD